MNFLNEKNIRDRAAQYAQQRKLTADKVLASLTKSRQSRYDVFLSQTIRDAELVLGVYLYLTDRGYTVFCDWIAAPEIDRSEVSPANAAFVRKMMGISDCLMFLDTQQADQSLWMCWELGWFDGNKRKVCIVPVLREYEEYRAREFLGLYPYIEIDALGKLQLKRPIVTSPAGLAILEAPSSRGFDTWLADDEDYLPHAWGAWRDQGIE
jgi:hypothetical protein